MNELILYKKPATMVPLVKEQWVRKLKSNKYIKSRRVYKTDYNCFCPIGLLLDILNPEGWRQYKGSWYNNLGIYSDQRFFEKTGLTWDNFSQITKMNDFTTMTLPEIGQWVEENL